jgi:hypothetical protein
MELQRTKTLLISTDKKRQRDTSNTKKLIVYCEKCSLCEVIFESDSYYLLCPTHKTHFIIFKEQ